MKNSAENILASSVPKLPRTLSREARQWWTAICEEYDIGDGPGLLLLESALECFDRMRQAQKLLRRAFVFGHSLDPRNRLPCIESARFKASGLANVFPGHDTIIVLARSKNPSRSACVTR